MIAVEVPLAEQAYEVLVGPGARHELAAALAARTDAGRAAFVTQGPVEEAGWLDGLDPGIPAERFMIPNGEAAKRLATVEDLCRGFTRAGLSRRDVVVAVGGGVVSDVAGLAASLYHRGVAYVTVATTLLAQVDAAIGGKTGVNLPEGKNLVGTFWQPRAVLCDTDTLSTLPGRELACGRGEMAKYAFLGSGATEGTLLGASLEEQVAACARIKAAVVAADERESGQRVRLNYGHTLAHALEAAAAPGEPGAGRWDLRHGEAVAVGLAFAARLARRLGRIDDARVGQHDRVLAAFDLPGDLPAGADASTLLPYLGRDKKAHQDLAFVLDGPDGVELVPRVDADAVVATLVEMGGTS